MMDWDDAVNDGIAGEGAHHKRNTNVKVSYQWESSQGRQTWHTICLLAR